MIATRTARDQTIINRATQKLWRLFKLPEPDAYALLRKRAMDAHLWVPEMADQVLRMTEQRVRRWRAAK